MLTVEFAGETHEVTQALTFGRAADVCIDENQYMHRCVGEFFHDGGLWWLRNRGSRIPLTLISSDGKRVELPPEAVLALSGSGGVVRFQAGRANYELSYHGAATEPGPTNPGNANDEDPLTLRFHIELTPREVDFLVCFCAPQIGRAVNSALPSYAQVADVWGVSVKTLDNTLQNLRRKIREAGLVGAESSDALASFALSHGLIGHADLEWAALDLPDGPRQSSQGPRFTAPS